MSDFGEKKEDRLWPEPERRDCVYQKERTDERERRNRGPYKRGEEASLL